ncbi:hypothetical protein [Streptomyces zaomyceticus]|uniref:hypothetical protein n=1 Tax=Streptomyces zaomyceticus TaxID=68286 RepID=UPI002E0EA363|nr:hypothetical protein OG237_20295 [Streptomyces zaomyceticus]
MSNRHSAVRTARTRTRTERRATLLVLLDRLDRLSPAEAALLLEYAHAELAASDALRSTQVGLERALQQAQEQIRAAEAAIVEAEQDRDRARELYEHANARANRQYEDVERLGHYLNGVRRELGGVLWPDLPHAVRQLVAERTETARDHPEEP